MIIYKSINIYKRTLEAMGEIEPIKISQTITKELGSRQVGRKTESEVNMILKLKELMPIEQPPEKPEDKMYQWHYIEARHHIRKHDTTIAEISSREDNYCNKIFPSSYGICRDVNNLQHICVIEYYNYEGYLHRIATMLSAFLLNNKGNNIERLN